MICYWSESKKSYIPVDKMHYKHALSAVDLILKKVKDENFSKIIIELTEKFLEISNIYDNPKLTLAFWVLLSNIANSLFEHKFNIKTFKSSNRSLNLFEIISCFGKIYSKSKIDNPYYHCIITKKIIEETYKNL